MKEYSSLNNSQSSRHSPRLRCPYAEGKPQL